MRRIAYEKISNHGFAPNIKDCLYIASWEITWHCSYLLVRTVSGDNHEKIQDILFSQKNYDETFFHFESFGSGATGPVRFLEQSPLQKYLSNPHDQEDCIPIIHSKISDIRVY